MAAFAEGSTRSRLLLAVVAVAGLILVGHSFFSPSALSPSTPQAAEATAPTPDRFEHPPTSAPGSVAFVDPTPSQGPSSFLSALPRVLGITTSQPVASTLHAPFYVDLTTKGAVFNIKDHGIPFLTFDEDKLIQSIKGSTINVNGAFNLRGKALTASAPEINALANGTSEALDIRYYNKDLLKRNDLNGEGARRIGTRADEFMNFSPARDDVQAALNAIDLAIGNAAAGGAPVGAAYVTISSNPSLSGERTLIAGTGLSLGDGGSNGNATLGIDSTVATLTGSQTLTNKTLSGALALAPAGSSVGITVKGAASQSANLQEWQNDSGTVLTKINQGGAMTVNTLASDSGPAMHIEKQDTTGVGAGEFMLRFQTPFAPQGEYSTYFNNSAALYSLAWVNISGRKTGNGDNFRILPPTGRPYMIGGWSDVDSHTMVLRDNATAGAYHIGFINDATGQYVLGIMPNGALRWGATTTFDGDGLPTFDVNLYRSAADQLRTDDNLTSAVGLQAGTGTGTAAYLEANISATDANSERVFRLSNANINSGNSEFRGYEVHLGNGNSYPDGWVVMGGVNNSNTHFPMLSGHMSGNGGRSEVVFGGDVRLPRTYDFQANSSLGAIVPYLQFSAANNVLLGPRYSGASGYSTEFYVDGTAGNFTWKDNTGGQPMILEGTGNLGIGVTNPGYKLEVAGMVNASSDGVSTKVVAGACSDGTFTGTAHDGLVCIDSSNGRICYRYGGTWHYSAQTAGFQIPNLVTDGRNETEGLQPGDLVIGRLNERLSDGALHGLYEKFDLEAELTKLLATNQGLAPDDLKGLNVKGVLTVHGAATFLGDVAVKGRLSLSNQQAGFAVVPKGQREVRVEFDKPFETTPLISLTLKADDQVPFSYREDSTKGFTIRVSQPASTALTFAWQAIPVPEVQTVTGESTDEPVSEETSESPTDPEPTSEEDTTSPVAGPVPTSTPLPSTTPEPVPALQE